MKILLIEDYEPLRNSVAKGLTEAGYTVEATGDGDEGLWYAREFKFDLIVLDLMLPGIDGLSILRKLRESGDSVHVLILTARDTISDRVAGLDLGADDYIVKPFAFEEFHARVRALLRRKYSNKSSIINIEHLRIDMRSREVFSEGDPIQLTAREYGLLELLALRVGTVVTRDEIWENLYDFAADANSNVIDVYISYLRKKLERAGHPKLIHTRRGTGYYFGVTD